MYIYSLPPLLSTIAFILLILIVLKKTHNRVARPFKVYLAISVVYCLGTFILLAGFFPGQIYHLTIFPSLFAIAMSVSYYHFVCQFTHRTGRLAVWLGYAALVFILLPLFFLGYFPKNAQLTSTGLSIDYGAWVYLLAAMGFTYLALSITRLIQRYRYLVDPLERSRVIYLFIGIAILTVAGGREGIPPLPRFPLSQVGHLGNALIITYTILRYQLLDIKLIMKKGLAYSGITAMIAAVLIGILYALQEFLNGWSQPASIASIVALAILMTLSFNWLRHIMEKTVNLMFYGKSYDYRKMVMNFTQRMGNVLELERLADAMLRPITKALSTNQASLLLDDNGYFSSRFATRFIEGETIVPIRLRKESPITTWLTRERKPLHRDLIHVNPNFKALWESDVQGIARCGSTVPAGV